MRYRHIASGRVREVRRGSQQQQRMDRHSGVWQPLDEEPEPEHRCDEPGCNFVAKSPAGLGAHKRSH